MPRWGRSVRCTAGVLLPLLLRVGLFPPVHAAVAAADWLITMQQSITRGRRPGSIGAAAVLEAGQRHTPSVAYAAADTLDRNAATQISVPAPPRWWQVHAVRLGVLGIGVVALRDVAHVPATVLQALLLGFLQADVSIHSIRVSGDTAQML